MAVGPVVDVEGLTVRFGGFTAVRNVSFTVDRGEIFGFLGANGAGKTTTIRVLCGLLAPSEGQVRVAGLDFSDGGFAIKRKVGYMSQKFTLYDDLTVDENLAFAAQLRKIDSTTFKRRRAELLEFISFNRGLDQFVRDLPGGIKQQVSLAASLLHDPEVIFLDEPTAGVTPASRARFWALIRELAGRGRTVFVTTHYMDEAEQCGRIALMRTGELIALESPAQLKRTVFPSGLIELEPREGPEGVKRARELALRLARDPAFRLFEPYGLRYHAEIGERERWLGLKPEIDEVFRSREVAPTLEDVFIRLIEGNSR
jgi:ABC-2 type transport system ATP-binding protein